MSLRKRSLREEEEEEEEGEGGGENGGSLAIDTVSVYIVDATGYKLLYTCVLYNVLLSLLNLLRDLSAARGSPQTSYSKAVQVFCMYNVMYVCN